MDLVDKIEKRRFVGREFLVFLWFEIELCEGRIDVPGFGTCEIVLDGQITLVLDKEQSRLKGTVPSSAPEAHEALRQGKLPIHAHVRVTRGDQEFAFLFNADTLGLSAIKIPAVVKEEADEQFYERMYLIEDLEALFGSLYGRFLSLRLSSAWEETVAPAIRTWVRGDPLMHESVYRKTIARVPGIRPVDRPRTIPPSAPAADAAEAHVA